MPVRGNESKQNDAPKQQLALVLIPRTSPTPIAHVSVADSNHLKGGKVQAEQYQATGSASTRGEGCGHGAEPRLIGGDAVKHPLHDGIDHDNVERHEHTKDEQIDAGQPINQCVSDLPRRDAMVIAHRFEQHRHALIASLLIHVVAGEVS